MSSPSLSSLLPILIIAAVLALMGFAILRSRKSRHEAWKALAARHEWTFTETKGALEVQGLHHGRQLSLLTEQREGGKHRHTAAVLRLDLGDVLGRSLLLEPESLEDTFLELFGGKGEEVGDAALDLKRISPEVRALLRAPEVARHLLELRASYASFSIVAGMLEAELRGFPETLEALEAGVLPALGLANALYTARQQLPGRTSV
ncbi:hypothetical protein [Pyxidicoccus caerfyrddinensis]|uniref:hypothetical protein n=1 Tax=Pyxidicoccus caerfyrddinensis TaxID=2709663 RepID=UPI0013DAD5CF|nr:hypothetical protein [Pyxidicoccus caerfyrddinensis]